VFFPGKGGAQEKSVEIDPLVFVGLFDIRQSELDECRSGRQG
jgi:hypothetical protein